MHDGGKLSQVDESAPAERLQGRWSDPVAGLSWSLLGITHLLGVNTNQGNPVVEGLPPLLLAFSY